MTTATRSEIKVGNSDDGDEVGDEEEAELGWAVEVNHQQRVVPSRCRRLTQVVWTSAPARCR